MKRTSDCTNMETEASSVKRKGKTGPERKKRKLCDDKKSNSDNIKSKLMEIYEKLRSKNLTKAQKQEIIDQVFSLIDGKERSVIFKHDCIRVLEFCVKFGTVEQRKSIYRIYQEHNMDLLKSKYGKHLVKKLIKYGNKDQRNVVIKSFNGNVKRLLKHKESSNVLEFIYHQYADATQRKAMLQEFYGPHYALLKATIGKDPEDVFNKEPDQKKKILNYMKETLTPLSCRDSPMFTIVQKALLDYFEFADESMKAIDKSIVRQFLSHASQFVGQLSSSTGRTRSDIEPIWLCINQLKEMAAIYGHQVVNMLHTYEGSRVSMHCIWSGSRKDRKLTIKSLKSFAVKICMEEYGHLVLLAIFDVVDDTVFIKKTLFPEIIEKIGEIMQDQYGRKVILYLINGRDKRFLTPKCISLLERGDTNSISKKDKETRQNELRNGILDPLFKYISANIEKVINDKSMCQLLLSALEYSSGSSLSLDIFNAITSLASTPPNVNADEEDYIIFHPCAHWVVKRLVQQDKARTDKGEVNIFSKVLISRIKKGCIGAWIQKNRGAFVVVSLLETEIPEVVDFVIEELKEVSSVIKDGQSKGLEVIRKITGSRLTDNVH